MRKLCRCSCARGLNRRGALAVFAGAGLGAVFGAAPAGAKAVVSRRRAEDESFMRLALAEAAKGDFPFGAVIVRDGVVAAAGRNSGIKTNDPTAHGEMVAIRNFCASRPAAGLKGATIYTTGEPCPMCMGAILWSGFGRMVYAASIERLSAKIGQIMTPSRSLADAARFETIHITGGVLAAEALALFK
ncbi:nucleoside deaminase [Methylocystis sp. JAN1]|uniref:nucleoside deaminase n=1 Tax=Methylocystis sp. JAN1 TaxID=3397211 RepID=UPI003FA32F88